MLDAVASWRSQVGRALDDTLTAIAAEERTVRRELDEMQRRYGALGTIRREEEARLSSLEEEALRRKRASVREALAVDRALLEERAGMLTEVHAAQDEAFAAGLDEPDVAEAVHAFLDHQEHGASVVEALDALSTEGRRLLEPYLAAAVAAPPPLPVPMAAVGVLVSADPPVGSPEALAMVIPVPWAVYADGTARPEDLCTLLAYRLVGALYKLLGTLGAAHAPVRFSDIQGNLGVQVWLGDHPIGEELREQVLEGISDAVAGAPELEAAGLEVYAVWLTPDLLAEAVS